MLPVVGKNRKVEEVDNQSRSYLPLAFDEALYRELTEQLAENPITIRPWMQGSIVWHYTSEDKRPPQALKEEVEETFI